jgi:hypothetical protein
MNELNDLLRALTYAIGDLDRAWPPALRLEQAAMHVRHHDVIHHVCMASADTHWILMREAYLSLLAFALYIARAEEAGAPAQVTTETRRALDALLDAIEPHVSRADAALRRCEDETFEETLARFLRDGK